MTARDPRRNTFLLDLSLPTSSLTDGTDIPPPAREPTPPPPSTPKLNSQTSRPTLARQNTNPLSSHPPNTDGATDGVVWDESKSHPNGTANGVGSRIGSPNGNANANGMLSPKSPASRDGSTNSVRRFLSRGSLNNQYKNPTGLSASASLASLSSKPQQSAVPKHLDMPGRPDSSLSFVSVGGTKTKRKRSWWARLMGKGDEENNKRKRGSVIQERDEEEEERRSGPPAPRLPELRGLSREGKDEGLGEDMFRDIR